MAALESQRILIVNDDGITAPGIRLLAKLMQEQAADVWIVAPTEERSGASSSVSMHMPIRVHKHGEREFAISGTPTDAVIMAFSQLMPELPSLVLSGINRGANLGDDIHYSGTIAAAGEATQCGVSAIALSQVFIPGQQVPWETAERYTIPVIEQLLALGMPAGTFLNVNFPPVAPEAVVGIRAAHQAARPPRMFRAEARVDCRDIPYFWPRLCPEPGGDLPGTDLAAISEGAIAVSPIKLNRTDNDHIARIQEITFSL